MRRTELRNKVCRALCKYYKPSKNEELACGGFLVIEKLMHAGRAVPFESLGGRINPATREELVRNLCVLCPFYEDGCDFVKQRESPPCGGFLLLCNLLELEAVSIDNIRDVG